MDYFEVLSEEQIDEKIKNLDLYHKKMLRDCMLTGITKRHALFIVLSWPKEEEKKHVN